MSLLSKNLGLELLRIRNRNHRHLNEATKKADDEVRNLINGNDTKILSDAGFSIDTDTFKEFNTYRTDEFAKLSEAYGVENVYDIQDIKALAIDYRFRFLRSEKYKGSFPPGLTEKIESIIELWRSQSEGTSRVNETPRFYILAPSKLMKLEDTKPVSKDIDPVLFMKPNKYSSSDYYVKVAKWGSDTNIIRKTIMSTVKTKAAADITKFSIGLVVFSLAILFLLSFPGDSGILGLARVASIILMVAGFVGFVAGVHFVPSDRIWNSSDKNGRN